MTEPVKMWAVVRDDGKALCAYDNEAVAMSLADFICNDGGRNYSNTVKPCTVRIIEDD